MYYAKFIYLSKAKIPVFFFLFFFKQGTISISSSSAYSIVKVRGSYVAPSI